MSCRLYKDKGNEPIQMRSLNPGQIGEVVSEGAYKGKIIIKDTRVNHFNIVGEYNSFDENNTLLVRVLQPGELIEVGE